MIQMETQHLILRDFLEDDLAALFTLLNNVHAMQYIMDLYAQDLAAAKENLSHAMASARVTPRQDHFFAVIEKATGRFVGSCGFSCSPSNGKISKDGGTAELGYFYLPKFWGRGFAKEAAIAMVHYGFNTVGLHRLYAGCAATNTASQRVLIAAGFQLEGTLRAHQWVRGQWTDRLLFGQLKG